MADVQLQLCRKPPCDISAYTAPAAATNFSLTRWPHLYRLIRRECLPAPACHNPSLSRRPPQSLGDGRWEPFLYISPGILVKTHLLTPHTSLWLPKPHRCLIGQPCLAPSSLGTAPERNRTYTLGFWFRLSWGLPKYSNLRVKGVCIGERLVRMRAQLTRVLRGTLEPKSRRSSSRQLGHSSVLGTLPRAQGTKLQATLGPAQRAPSGSSVRAAYTLGFILGLPPVKLPPTDASFLSAQDAKRGLNHKPSLTRGDWPISRLLGLVWESPSCLRPCPLHLLPARTPCLQVGGGKTTQSTGFG